MFKKPFKVKSNSQLKGSDRKKLLNDLQANFSSLSEDSVTKVLPPKEPVFMVKLVTHSGQLVILYCVQKLPVVFDIDGVMYPTVFMLWHVPDLLYTFTTHPQVFSAISGGADLMLPGVICRGTLNMNSYGKVNKGTRVAINLSNNKAPIAVGITALSSFDMYMAARRGKCVQVFHCYGDQLSNYGTKLQIPELGPVFMTKEDSVEDITTEDNKKSDETECTREHENGQKSGIPEYVKKTALPDENEDYKKKIEQKDEKEENIDSAPPVNSMDNLITYCFLKALKTSVKKVELPILVSSFYKVHMIPACPQSMTIDLKKSSYKKISNFLEDMVKKKVITLQTVTKGVQSVSHVHYENSLLKDFFDEYAEDEPVKCPVVDQVSSKNAVPEITEQYTITAAVLPVFERYLYKKKDSVSVQTVRKVITDYVKQNNLQVEENKKLVKPDLLLQNIVDTIDNIPWDKLFSKIISKMGHSFKVELSGNDMAVTRGKLQPIDIQVGSRSGNKKVTLINNLELYGINIQEFSRECQHGVAASTTINTIPGMKSAQLQVQGNQVLFVGKLLTEKYQIPKKHIRGMENAPKTKKMSSSS